MSSLNKAQIIGRLGQDPEVKYLPSGAAVANLSVATSERWTDKQTGEKQERTEWHRVTLYGRIAEVAGEYLQKGGLVYIEGRIQTRKWQAQDGTDRSSTEIIGNELKMLSPKGERGQSSGRGQPSENGRPSERQYSNDGYRNSSETQPRAGAAVDEFNDEIPF